MFQLLFLFTLCFTYVIADLELLRKLSAFDYDEHRDENGQLTVTGCPTEKVTETIHPCDGLSGDYLIQKYGAIVPSKFKYMSLDGRDVKLRLTRRDMWHVDPVESSEIYPFYLTTTKGVYLGAGRKIMGTYRLQTHHKYVNLTYEKDQAIQYVPWCGVTTGSIYLQAIGSNFWLSQSEFGDNLIYKSRECPPSAFKFDSQDFKHH